MNFSSNLTYHTNLSDLTHVTSCPVIFPENFPATNVAATIAIFVVNILSSFTAATANFLVLWAITKTPSLHTPSSVLLFCLAFSDFVTGAFVQPLFSAHLIGVLTHNFPLYCISGAILYPVGSSFLVLSFLAITAISFDRYLSLVLHLRYATIVTVSRVIKLNLLLFIPAFPLSIYFWFSREDWFKQAVTRLGLIVIVVGIITIPFSYCQIFTILRRHKKQIQNQKSITTGTHGSRISPMEIAKYRKSVLTILFVLGAVILSYFPVIIRFGIARFSKMEVSGFTLIFGGIMVFLNSSINPLVYCWRMKEIRLFVLSKLRCVFRVSGLSDGAVRVNRVRPVNIPSYRETPVWQNYVSTGHFVRQWINCVSHLERMLKYSLCSDTHSFFSSARTNQQIESYSCYSAKSSICKDTLPSRAPQFTNKLLFVLWGEGRLYN